MFLLEFGINFVVALLLVVTIGYCWTLNKRIRILQDSRSELAELLSHFDISTQKASDSIVALQVASKKIGETIQARIEKANYVSDDLNFLIERADKLAERLGGNGQISGSNGVTRTSAPAALQPEIEQAKRAVQKAKAAVEEQEHRPEPRITRANDDEPETTSQSLQGMLEKLAARANSDPVMRSARAKAAQTAQAQQQRPRSRAEQELLEIIKAGNKV